MKSCAVSGCLQDIKRTLTSLANANIKAVWPFEDVGLLRTDVMHQQFVRATTATLLLRSKCKMICEKMENIQSCSMRYFLKTQLIMKFVIPHCLPTNCILGFSVDMYTLCSGTG